MPAFEEGRFVGQNIALGPARMCSGDAREKWTFFMVAFLSGAVQEAEKSEKLREKLMKAVSSTPC